MIYDVIENLVENYPTPADYADFSLELMKVLAIEPGMTEKEYADMEKEDKVAQLHAAAMENLNRKSARIIEIIMPVITEAVANGETGIRAIPITDGKRIFRVMFDLEEAVATEGRSIIKEWQ